MSLESEQKVTIDHVYAASNKGIDYDKLIKTFGSSRLTSDHLQRIERLTGKPAHHYLRRGIFFSHRNIDEILNCAEKKQPFYIYTGRGPSNDSMHVGHLVPFIFCKYLQEAFDVPLVIQITDDEKFLHKDLTIEETYRMGKQNIKDIIACGFDSNKTFIFSDIDYISGSPSFYQNILKIQKCYNINQTQSIFGFTEADNVGKYAFAAIQAAPSFSSSFPHLFPLKSKIPCLIPCAIDQDPYFRLTRDIAPRIKYLKPSLIHSTFIPALQGAQTKMSSSNEQSAIYLSDTPNMISKKIKKYAFSGGRDSIEDHRQYGADITVDVSIAYLNYFLEDDNELQRIKDEYSAGRMLTGEVKEVLIKCLQNIVQKHQEIKNSISEEDIAKFTQFKTNL